MVEADDVAPVRTSRALPREDVIGLAAIGLAFAGAAAWSWRKWPDLLVDFGVQLYIPWRLLSGASLHRDVTHLNGPLSQYVDAALFRLFGASATTLFTANLALAAVLVVLIHRAFARWTGPRPAAAAGLVTVLVFAFAHYVGTGNYNFISPYCQEATHGLLLGVVGVRALERWSDAGRPGAAAGAGAAAGFALLTKPEVFAAVAATMVAAVVLAARRRGRVGPGVTVMLAAAAGPSLAFWLGLLPTLGAAGSARAVFWPWIVLATTDVTDNDFYRWCLGLDQPLRNLAALVLYAWALAAAVLVGAWCGRRDHATPVARVAAAAGALGLLIAAWHFPWPEGGRALPLVTLVTAGAFLREAFRGASSGLALWSVLSLFLLAKMGLNARIWQYGFTLALPATLSLLAFVLFYLPPRLALRGVDARRFRNLALLVAGVAVLQLLRFSDSFYAAKTLPVGEGGDRLVTYGDDGRHPEGPAVREALAWIAAHTGPRSTLAVFPEGVVLNYLARRPNPTRYVSFIPAEIAVYGEETMLRDLDASPPDTVVLLHRDTTEHGVRFFGEPARPGGRIRQWIRDRYVRRHLIGAEPLVSEAFGIEILGRAR